ncbi:MAG: MFS transporter [Ruthenibacterium lactatiformans]
MQERYGLSYQWSGLLLAMLSVGNLAAGFAAGMLPAHWGQGRTVLMLAGGAALGYGAMILTGSPWALLAAFTLVGVAKGTTLNTSSALIAAHARERTKCMNLIHACFATGSLLCPLFIAALGMGGLPWWAPMAGLALCGAALWACSRWRSAGPRRRRRACQKRLVFSAFAPFWVLTGLVFSKLHGDQRHGLDGDIFQDVGILSGPRPDDRYGHLGCNTTGRLCIAFVFPVKTASAPFR